MQLVERVLSTIFPVCRRFFQTLSFPKLFSLLESHERAFADRWGFLSLVSSFPHRIYFIYYLQMYARMNKNAFTRLSLSLQTFRSILILVAHTFFFAPFLIAVLAVSKCLQKNVQKFTYFLSICRNDDVQQKLVNLKLISLID